MPLAADATAPAPQVTVEVSAVVDLYAFLSGCGYERGKPRGEIDDLTLIDRAEGFWEEGPATHMAFDELAVLAALGGFLPGGETASGFVSALPELATRPPVALLLRTEQEETRERTLRHLQVLREDPERRARYVALVADAAEALRPRWVANLSALHARAGWLRDRLEAGEDLTSLLPPRHIAMLPRYRGLVEEGIRLGNLLLVPTLGPDIVYDLPWVMLIGVRLQADDSVESARRRTARVAERLRALGDPTRLAIAAYLSKEPASVSGLARAFGLSQPTVSAHIRSLRSAGLLDSHRSGGMTDFRLAEGHLTDLFQEAQEALFGDHS
jgi:DNA-binding transcriptional ArsR family regulator